MKLSSMNNLDIPNMTGKQYPMRENSTVATREGQSLAENQEPSRNIWFTREEKYFVLFL